MTNTQEGIDQRQRRWDVPGAAAALFFLLTFGSVCFYITKTYKAYLNSDAAVANILAGEIWRSGHFFPPDWWYVNGDLWVAFKQVLIIPWAMMGNNGFGAHAFAVVVGSALMLGSGFALLRQAGCARTTATWGISVLCFGYSDYYLETVYGQAAYSWPTTYLLLLLALVLKVRKSEIEGTRSKSLWVWLAALIYIVALANPARFVAYDLAPMIGALGILAACTLERRHSPLKMVWPSLYLVGAGVGCVAALGVAYFNHRNLLLGLNNASDAANAALVPIETLPSMVGYALNGILSMLGIDWTPGLKLASIQGLLVLAKLCLYPMLVIAPAIALCRNSMAATFEQKFVVLTGYVGLLLTLVLLCTSTLQGSRGELAIPATRYLAPFILIILLSNTLVWSLYRMTSKLYVVAALVIALVCSWSHIFPAGLLQQQIEDDAANIGYSYRSGWRQQIEKRNHVIQALQQAGLKTGYAPYWHSHVYTVLSKGAVEVRPVHMTGGHLRPWLHLSSSRWYKSGYADGEVFLLIPLTEKGAILPGIADGCSPPPFKQFEIEDYLVMVFKKNPLLESFARNLDSTGIVCLSAKSLTQIGTYDAARARLTSPAGSRSGLLHYGPYGVLAPGSYTVTFQVDVENPPDTTRDIGYVEVTANNGETHLARQKLLPGEASITLPVRVSGRTLQGVELRVFSFGTAEVSLRAIEVTANGH